MHSKNVPEDKLLNIRSYFLRNNETKKQLIIFSLFLTVISQSCYSPALKKNSNFEHRQAEEKKVEIVGSDATIFFSTTPPVADVYLDGKYAGKSNILDIPVLSGEHEVKFVKGKKSLTIKMTFKKGKNPSKNIDL